MRHTDNVREGIIIVRSRYVLGEPGDAVVQLDAVKLLDKGKRHVDGCRYSRRGPEAVVDDVARWGYPRHIFPVRRDERPCRLVGRHAAVVEEARARREEGPRAHSEKVVDLGHHGLEVLVNVQRVGVPRHRTAGDQQDVEFQVQVIHGGLADNLELVRRVVRVANGRCDDNVGVARGDDCDIDVTVGSDKVEDLEGAVDVKQIHARIGQDAPFLRRG